ncbi:hypothetical protein K0M31_014390 [Melipona bicolor]|uniref:Uncharacterized protein n=1 Tax=Melipona bicolor TaxID=60889 RepID=A0AA40G8G2_9HYME|nr:hypothetical protein K0M31_014390 [Melipona bicolor]
MFSRSDSARRGVDFFSWDDTETRIEARTLQTHARSSSSLFIAIKRESSLCLSTNCFPTLSLSLSPSSTQQSRSTPRNVEKSLQAPLLYSELCFLYNLFHTYDKYQTTRRQLKVTN